MIHIMVQIYTGNYSLFQKSKLGGSDAAIRRSPEMKSRRADPALQPTGGPVAAGSGEVRSEEPTCIYVI